MQMCCAPRRAALFRLFPALHCGSEVSRGKHPLPFQIPAASGRICRRAQSFRSLYRSFQSNAYGKKTAARFGFLDCETPRKIDFSSKPGTSPPTLPAIERPTLRRKSVIFSLQIFFVSQQLVKRCDLPFPQKIALPPITIAGGTNTHEPHRAIDILS